MTTVFSTMLAVAIATAAVLQELRERRIRRNRRRYTDEVITEAQLAAVLALPTVRPLGDVHTTRRFASKLAEPAPRGRVR